ncbi:MAG: hypothetical protein WDZ59_03805 [Pirellulales bacterium]
MRADRVSAFVAAVLLVVAARPAMAQSFGVELHNMMMPASGGMAGVSLALPQDLQSAINGNPATLTQFRGTQFSFGGGWAEATYNISQPVPLPLLGIDPYDAKSDLQGAALGNIGVTQDLSALGMPITFGLGFVSNAGAGVDFRHVPASNGTSADFGRLCCAGHDQWSWHAADRSALGWGVTDPRNILSGRTIRWQ